MKRCIAFCLALGAALSLTACGGGDTEGGLLCEASGIRPDTVLLSVDGRDVSAQRYLYWLAYACDYIADYYDSGEGIQWGDTVSGQSLEDYAKDQALQNAALYATVETWAEDYGCTLTDEDRTAMDREWAARAAQYGGEEAYLAVLARMGLDRAEAEAISGDYYLYEHLYDLYCTEGSELAPAEHDLETFAQEQGYLTVDHIWLSTAAVDPADAEAVAACRARAEEAFSKLNGSADPAHDFAVLAATYSDETDRDQHPSGYTFTVGDGTLPAACEEAAQALEEGQFSEPVNAFHAAGLEPDIKYTIHDDYAIMTMVEAGLGVSILAELMLRRTNFNIACLPIDPPVYRSLAVAYKDSLPIASKYFIDYLLEHAAELP